MELTKQQEKEVLKLIDKFDLEFIQIFIKLLEKERKEARKELLKWWISALEQGAYTEKEALELMEDQLESLETNKENK